MRRTTRWALCFALLTVLLASLALLGLATGSVRVPLGALLRPAKDLTAARILDLRLRRVLSAALLGGALSVSGFLLQTFFANPIAGPFVLGISSGAKLTVALAMVFFLGRGVVLGSAGLYAAAFAGSLTVMALILAASRAVRQMSLLVVCGVMVGYLCSAVTDLVVTFASDSSIVDLHAWSLGSFAGISWGNLRLIAAVVLSGLAWAFLLTKPMAAYQMGESYARSVGVRTERFRPALILVSSILSACVTAFAGPVSFVGVAVPHLMRSLLGSAKPILMVPACFLGGAAFCLGCDLAARTLFAPTELSIGTVTAVAGAPVVLRMLLPRNGRAEA